jgi:hypothetical protein
VGGRARRGRGGAPSPSGPVAEGARVGESGPGEDGDDLPKTVAWPSNAIGIVPRVVSARSIPFTTSGKLRRSWVRQAYARGELDGLMLARGPSGDGPGTGIPLTSAEVDA